jgi:hypothetical protein
MRICLCTLHSPEYRPLANITLWQNKMLYAERYGYVVAVKTDGLTGAWGWDKIQYLADIMGDHPKYYDWLYWSGCDTLITNFTIPLERFAVQADEAKAILVIANDVNGWNSDSFLIKCCPQGRAFLEMVLAMRSRLQSHSWQEQQAMIEMGALVPSLVRVVPQKELNSNQYSVYGLPDDTKDKLGNPGNWTPGDFLIHWSGCGLNDRMKLAQQYLPLVIT